MNEYETRVMSVIVAPKGDSLFSEMATKIYIDDEAGGEYVKVEQNRADGNTHNISIEPDEWPAIRDAIERMLGDCRG